MMGFYNNGEIFFSAQGQEDDFDYDEIGAKLEIDKLQKERSDFICSLALWYVLYKTEEGSQIRETLE